MNHVWLKCCCVVPGHVWILSPSFSFDPEQSLIVTVHVVTSPNRVIVRPLASFPSEWGKKGGEECFYEINFGR